MQNLSVKEPVYRRPSLPVIFSFVMSRIIPPLSKIKAIKALFCFLLFFAFTASFAQQKNTVIEDDYETLKGKIRLNFNASTDRALMYANQMAKSTNYEHLAFANAAMSCLLQTKREEAKSKEKFKIALRYLDKMPDSEEKSKVTADVYNYGGLAEWYRKNHSAALEMFQTGIKFSSRIGDIKQIVKLKANIALVNESVGNYRLSIKYGREILEAIANNEGMFDNEELQNRKSNVYLGLGSAYEAYYVDKYRMEILDSAAYFYKKSIQYSDAFPQTEGNAKLSLGNISSWKKDYKNAEKIYFEVVNLAIKSEQIDLLSICYYNLGDLYRSNGKYSKALSFYKKTDSIEGVHHLNSVGYLESNFYQARIYNELKMPEEAHKHSRIYLDLLDKSQSKLREERLKVNYRQGEDNLTTEMLSIEKKYKEKVFFNKMLNVLYMLLFAGVLFFLIRIRDKTNFRKKMIELVSDVSKRNKSTNQSVDKVIPIKTNKIKKRKSKFNV